MYSDLSAEVSPVLLQMYSTISAECIHFPANASRLVYRLQNHSTLFAEGMRLVAKESQLICRRHAPCSKSTPLYLQKACALLQELSFYSQKVCTLLRKYSTVFAEGMRLVAKALSHYGRRHAPCSKSNPL